jgi:hypothetical protein
MEEFEDTRKMILLRSQGSGSRDAAGIGQCYKDCGNTPDSDVYAP